ncbi:hypothetical protein ACETK3_13525 [Arthrobacter sp. E44]|uniref:hypothetical protein n=1 Tax=Arthrobacter sp. E44 TaxID=3341794 RepID=UPI0035A5C587
MAKAKRVCGLPTSVEPARDAVERIPLCLAVVEPTNQAGILTGKVVHSILDFQKAQHYHTVVEDKQARQSPP